MRARLLTLAAVPLVPAVLLVLLLVILQSLRVRQEAEESALRVARALAVAVDSQIREVEASLGVLAVSTSLHEQDLAAFHRQALLFQKSTDLGTVVLLGTNGQQVVNTSRAPGSELPALGAGAPAMPIITHGKPMARVVSTPSTGKPMTVIGVPVRVQGEVRYALSTAVSFRRFDDLLRQQRLPPSWIGVVLDPARIVVARTSEQERFVGGPASPSLIEALRTSTEGAFDGVSLDGIPVRTVFSSAGPAGWSVAVGVPKAELARDLYVSLAWLSLATLFVFAFAVASAWWYAARIGQAVQRLTSAAEDLGRGEAVHLEPLGIREGDQLAGAMSRASSELRQASTGLARNEARWSAVLDSAMDGIVAVDETQRIVIYNPAAERIFGWGSGEAIGQPLTMLIPTAQRGKHEDLVRAFGRAGDASRRMGAGRLVSGLRKNGEVFPIEASISHLDTGEGELYTVIVRDVTQAVRAREELAQMAAEASNVREQEKARIARELHDELAQSLAALKMDLKSLGEADARRAGVPEQIERMLAMVDSSVAATRRIAADLRPLVLDDLGLPAAIDWLATEFTNRTGVPCSVELRGDMELPEPYATGIFRVLQESLANVGKHARARQVVLSAERGATEVVLAVADDGAGFDTGDARKPLSLGLAGMRERVHLMQGAMTVTSQRGLGTRVEVRIPYAPAEAPPH